MLDFDEKRDYVRTDVNCDITYKLADSTTEKNGNCTSLSGAGIAFIADCAYGIGLAMVVKVFPPNSDSASMTVFIEVVRSVQQDDNSYKIAGSIKSLK